MATPVNEHVDLTPYIRHYRLQELAKAARNLASAAESGRSNDLIASQLGLTVRWFSGALDEQPGCEAVSFEIDRLGVQIQEAGKGLRG